MKLLFLLLCLLYMLSIYFCMFVLLFLPFYVMFKAGILAASGVALLCWIFLIHWSLP